MIYSAQTELAFENALQQLMDSFNVDGEYIIDHLEAKGVNVDAYDTIHKYRECLDKISDVIEEVL